MDSEQRRAVIHGILESFNAGDLEAVAAAMTDDVDFRETGPESIMPWVRPRRGRAQVSEYLAEVSEALAIEPLEIEKILCQGEDVLVLGHSRMQVRANGNRAEVDFVMHFELEGGQIRRYRNYYDTHRYVAAIRGE